MSNVCLCEKFIWVSFFSDSVSGNSRCERIIAAFIAMLEIVVSSTNDNSYKFYNSMNRQPGLFLLRAMKRGFH